MIRNSRKRERKGRRWSRRQHRKRQNGNHRTQQHEKQGQTPAAEAEGTPREPTLEKGEQGQQATVVPEGNEQADPPAPTADEGDHDDGQGDVNVEMDFPGEEDTEDSLDRIDDPDDRLKLTRQQKEELEAHILNYMQGTVYLDADLEGVLEYLQEAVVGGMEGTGMDYRQSRGQVAKVMLRCRNKRVAEEKDRMQRLFEEFQKQKDAGQLFPGRSAPKRSGGKKSAPGQRSTGIGTLPERSAQEDTPAERSVEISKAPETCPTDDRSAPEERSEPTNAPKERSRGRQDNDEDDDYEAPFEESETLTSFIGDEPPLFQSSTVEERRIPKATKSARRSLHPVLTLTAADEIAPMEAFKKIIKALQIEIFEGTFLTREQLVAQAWARATTLAPSLRGLSEEKADGHKMKFRLVIDKAFEAVELGLNFTLPPGVEQVEIRREIRNVMEGEGYLELTLGMIVFHLEETFKVNLLGAIGLVKRLMDNEKYRRAAMGKKHEEEAAIDDVPEGTVNWRAIRRRTEDLLRAGNNVLTMTDQEIITSVSNFCRIDENSLKQEKKEMSRIIKEAREQIQGKRKEKKTVQAPPQRRGRVREENWRQEAIRINRSTDRTKGGKKQTGPVRASSALARELARQAAEQAFKDQTEAPCINPREFLQEARQVALSLWRDEKEDRVGQKPKFTSYALAAIQEAYEEYAKRFFACVQIAADHRRTPSEIRRKAIKTVMDRDVELVVKLRSMDQ